MPPELQAARKYLGYAQLGAMGVMIGKMAYTALKTAALYVMKHGLFGTIRNLWNGTKSLASKAWNWISRKRKAAPGSCALCFSAATLVWTGCGQVPIQAVQLGDLVVTQDEATGALFLGQVTAKYEIPGAMLTNLRVAYPDGRVETIETTDEHPFWTSERGWNRVDTLHPGDTLHTLAGPARVESISFTSVRQTVCNFTVGGHANYFVSDDGVWVHNCSFNAVDDYWKPLYGWTSPPKREVILRDVRNGSLIRKIVSKEVHHGHPRAGGGTNAMDNLQEMWPWEHAELDAQRGDFFPYQLVDIIRDIAGF